MLRYRLGQTINWGYSRGYNSAVIVKMLLIGNVFTLQSVEKLFLLNIAAVRGNTRGDRIRCKH